MKSLTIFANAKINLGLEVLNKRNDGYHNINTIYAPITLCDELKITKSDSYELYCNVDFNLPMEKNLAMKSAILLQNKLGNNDKIKIELKKVIPSGAGLGGGSSDAAAVLIGMNDLFGYGLSKDELASIALEIGSDVPFFIYNKTAIASSRGEILEFINLDLNKYVLIIFPNISISTSEAYKSLNRGYNTIEGRDLAVALLSGDSERMRSELVNDFEIIATRSNPEIANIKDELYNYGSIFAIMSGSGSAVLGLFDNVETAAWASLNFANYQTFICQFM